jgi:hypothetical protein
MAKKHDVVYLVKDGAKNEELRYSLRSVEKNFPHGKVWFFGGGPQYLVPDERVKLAQYEDTKWHNTTALIRNVCMNPEVSDDWWLFNDDFFIMKPFKVKGAIYDRDLYRRIVEIENRNGMHPSVYSCNLRKTALELESRGLGVINYAVHMPMLINKEKALATLEEFPGEPMFRSLYGNHHAIGGVQIPDCKCGMIGQEFDEDAAFLSTSDTTWIRERVGEFIRETFTERCKYEKY